MKKALFFISLFAFLSINLSSQFAYSWLNNSLNETYTINGIESAANGNVYITGNFSSASDFDPSSASFILIPNNTTSCFLAKYNANGGFIWAKEIVADISPLSAYQPPSSHDLVIDKNENIYISGAYGGIADFDPSSSTYSLSAMAGTNMNRMFTAKYNSNGNLVWAKDYGQKSPAPSSGQHTKGIKIGLDSLNNVYQAGISFGNPIILKYNNSGVLLWKDSLYTLNSYASLNTMFVSPAGEIIISGRFTNTIDMDPTSGISNLYGSDAFYLGKYSTNGGLIFANKLNGWGGGQDNLIAHITADDLGNVYSCGTGYGGASIFKYHFCKWDNTGNLLWQNLFGNASIRYPTGISLNCNNITITGFADNTSSTPQNFDPSGGTYTTSASSGPSQIYIATFDAANGSILWAKTVGGKCSNVTNIVNNYALGTIINTSFIAPNGAVYLTGKNPSISVFPADDFDPGIGTVSTNTSASVFFAKYTGCSSAVGIEEYNKQNLISVSPNPSTDKFNFNGLVGENTIQIMDITGRVLLTEKTSSENQSINLNASQGMYFYKVSDKQNRVQQGKLILE